jgi:hypothetical protein
MKTHRHLTAFRALTAVALLAACSPKDAPKPDSVAVQSTDPQPQVVTIHANDFLFQAPTEILGGMTTFKLVNDGAQPHHLVIARLDSGKTMKDVQAAFAKPGGPPPRWLVFVGGPNAPDPKGESNATLDMPAGEYALLCFVDTPDGTPHFAKGMMQGLTVKPGTGAAIPAPRADVDITLSDYKFTLSKALAPGAHTFSVRTDAQQPHEIELIKLAPGKTADDFKKFLEKPEGPPPGSAIGGVAPILPGFTNYFSADLTAGDYLLICFIPDAKDGKPHFAHGMIQTVKVE